MTLIIALANLKGGSGKTTIAIHLAAALHQAGHRTLLADADDEPTALQWGRSMADNGHEGPTVIKVIGEHLRSSLQRVGEPFDCVVIDSPGKNSRAIKSAMMAADAVIIPCGMGPLEQRHNRSTAELFQEVAEARPGLVGAFLINKQKRRTVAELTAGHLASFGLPMLPPMSDLATYQEADALGLGVNVYKPRSKAAGEITAVVSALFSLMEATNGQQATA